MFAAASMLPGAAVLRELRALDAHRDSGCVMPPRRVAGDERSEPPVVPASASVDLAAKLLVYGPPLRDRKEGADDRRHPAASVSVRICALGVPVL